MFLLGETQRHSPHGFFSAAATTSWFLFCVWASPLLSVLHSQQIYQSDAEAAAFKHDYSTLRLLEGDKSHLQTLFIRYLLLCSSAESSAAAISLRETLLDGQASKTNVILKQERSKKQRQDARDVSVLVFYGHIRRVSSVARPRGVSPEQFRWIISTWGSDGAEVRES